MSDSNAEESCDSSFASASETSVSQEDNQSERSPVPLSNQSQEEGAGTGSGLSKSERANFDVTNQIKDAMDLFIDNSVSRPERSKQRAKLYLYHSHDVLHPCNERSGEGGDELMFHEEGCYWSEKEENRCLVALREVSQWPTITLDGAEAIAQLFDSLVAQEDFFSNDCCPQTYLTSMANDSLSQIYSKVLSLDYSLRMKIVLHMGTSKELPEYMRKGLVAMDTLLIPKRSSSSGLAIALPTSQIIRPLHPSVSDIKGENLNLFFEVLSG